MAKSNCGHTTRNTWIITDRYGYTKCLACSDIDTAVAIGFSNRLEGRLNDGRVLSLTGLPLGTIVSRTTNTGARTPTGGRYESDRMTVRDPFGGTWYANGPKDDDRIIMRRSKARHRLKISIMSPSMWASESVHLHSPKHGWQGICGAGHYWSSGTSLTGKLCEVTCYRCKLLITEICIKRDDKYDDRIRENGETHND